MMKRVNLILMLLAMAAATVTAQTDDMYFVPKKVKKVPAPRWDAAPRWEANDDRPAYYVGSNRDVDEYNRRRGFRSSYTTLGNDSLHNDVIDFAAGDGVYPDSLGLDSAVTSHRKNFAASDYDDADDYGCMVIVAGMVRGVMAIMAMAGPTIHHGIGVAGDIPIIGATPITGGHLS